MKTALTTLGALLLLGPTAAAADLDLSVESRGASAITVSPGDSVAYAVVGELSDTQSLGIASVLFDLRFDGGNLPQADAPVAAPMKNFDRPAGFSNPAGFGGTVIDGDLVQVGGAQNTINQLLAPAPGGAVITGVALPGSPQVIVTGSLTAPVVPGTYTLRLDGARANAIRLGETGTPFWSVDKVLAGEVVNLTIEVEALTADVASVSLGAGGTQTLDVDAGEANAGRIYLLLGSQSGTSPGLSLGMGLVLPLVTPDAYFDFTLAYPNSPPLSGSFGALDVNGEAVATFTVPPGSAPALAGSTVHHAYALLAPVDYVSNPVPVLLVP